MLARMADEDEPPLAFHAQTADGARIHFCVDSPVTLRFGDGSIAVLSLFPSAVRHARPPAPGAGLRRRRRHTAIEEISL